MEFQQDFDYRDLPLNADYFTLLPRATLFDFGGGSGNGDAAAAASAGYERAAGAYQGASQGAQYLYGNARDDTVATYHDMYNDAKSNLSPGVQAYARTTPYIGGLLGIPGYDKVDPTAALRGTPGYQFTMDQGTDALGRYAAARGMSMSGAQMKGLQTFGQGTADQTYQKYLSDLTGYAGAGQNASTSLSQIAMQNAAGLSNGYMGSAQGSGKALMEGAGGMANAYSQEGVSNAQSILAQASAQQSGYSGILGGLGMIGGAVLGGPIGASIGSSIGSGIGGWLGGGNSGYGSSGASSYTSPGYYSGGYGY